MLSWQGNNQKHFQSSSVHSSVTSRTPSIITTMGNISSMAAPLFDTGFKIAVYIFCYLLFIGVVLAVGISLCMYIDHRRQTRLSRATLDEERNVSEGEDEEKKVSAGKDGEEFPEGEDEKTPLLPPPSHQDQNRQLISCVQSCTYENDSLSLLSCKYGATTTPLRLLDKRPKWAYTVNKPATFPRLSVTPTTAPVPKLFTKCRMRSNEVNWNSKLRRWTPGQGEIVYSSRERRDEDSDVVIEPS